MAPPARLRALDTHLRRPDPAPLPAAAATPSPTPWRPIQLDAGDAGSRGDVLGRMCAGEVPAIVLRGALSPAECADVLGRLNRRGCFPPTFSRTLTTLPREQREPADPGAAPHAQRMGSAHRDPDAIRWDIGTSLGNLGDDPDAFFADAVGTHELFAETLGRPLRDRDPVSVMYRSLSALSGGTKTAMCAEQADGRLFGPAIFRSYRPGGAHSPHFDSVRYRKTEKPSESRRTLHSFDVQLAGVLLLQAPTREPGSEWGSHLLDVGGDAKEVAKSGQAAYRDSWIYRIPGREAQAKLEEAAAPGEEP